MPRHRSGHRPQPIGAVLAGGGGRRLGGDKASAQLAGRPLISYPLEAMCGALKEVAVIAKPGTRLPDLPGARLWLEPERPQHPLVGIVHALERAGGRAVLICAADLPLVTSALIRRISEADTAAPVLLACCGAQLQPLLGRYEPAALEALAPLAARPKIALRDAIAALDPLQFEVDDPTALHNVNSPQDLRKAAAMLDRRASRTGA